MLRVRGVRAPSKGTGMQGNSQACPRRLLAWSGFSLASRLWAGSGLALDFTWLDLAGFGLAWLLAGFGLILSGFW